MSATPSPLTQSTPLACDLAAIPDQERATHQALIERLFATASERQERPNGYAFRFPAEAYPQIAAFVANERRCCPFLTFTLELTPHDGPIWLTLTGPEGVKTLLHAVIQ